MITVTLGCGEISGKRVLLTFWPADAGELPDGGFDERAWQRSRTYLLAGEGSDPREAWRLAYRHVRAVSRHEGGFEWLDLPMDADPCPLPDRRPENPLWGVPGQVMLDNGYAFSSSGSSGSITEQ
jgi:hypothetical protein